MGADRLRHDLVMNYIRPFSGMKVLDIGCGPADILAYLPDVDYWGFDISEAYISRAQKAFAGRGKFHCKYLTKSDLPDLPKFDVVLAFGLLHHLDDSVAENVLELASLALVSSGHLVTIDPCLGESRNMIARLLIRHDRGQNVRDRVGYETLAKNIFPSLKVQVRHQAWIPYTHCIMECGK